MSLFDELHRPTVLTAGTWYRLDAADVQVIQVAGDRVWFRRAGTPRTQQSVCDVTWFLAHATVSA
jgi:hypothetical protein